MIRCLQCGAYIRRLRIQKKRKKKTAVEYPSTVPSTHALRRFALLCFTLLYFALCALGMLLRSFVTLDMLTLRSFVGPFKKRSFTLPCYAGRADLLSGKWRVRMDGWAGMTWTARMTSCTELVACGCLETDDLIRLSTGRADRTMN